MVDESNEKRKRNPLVNLVVTEWKHLGFRRKHFVIYMFLFCIAGALSLMNPLVIGYVFNSIQQSITSDVELKKLIMMISLLFFLNLGFWIFHGLARIFEESTGFFVHRNYTNAKIGRILELPLKWHKDHHSGDTIDKINRGRGSIESFSEGITHQLVYAVLNIFGSLIILFFIDAKIALFAFIFSFSVLFILMTLDKKLIGYYKQLNKYSNKLSAAIFDYLSNIGTVITLRLKKTVSKEIDNKLIASRETFKKTIWLNEFKWGFASLAITVMVVLVLSYRSYTEYYATGTILIGTLYILYGYLRNVGDTFYRFAELYGMITRYDARVEGAYPIDEAFDKLKEKTGGKLPYDWKEIELRGMNFTYDVEGKEQHVDNVNLKFQRGEKIALIGESGCGKSTVLALMRGLYSPDKGNLFVNGEFINNGFDKLKKEITLIPQDPEIFNNTIRNNITMDLSTRKEELEKAIEMAQLKKVIDRLEKGLNTNVLEKGVSLSGGEKQRLALARGILAARKSEIVLLDEPTSSVDSLNEMQIHENLFKEFKHKTIVSSIHRLHLLPKFDYIYMFEKGKIVAEGTLEEIKKNSKFKYIWRKYGMTKEIQ